MQVQINHQSFSLPEGQPASVTQLLQQAGFTGQTGIALAVNNKVVPRHLWPFHLLQQGDSITLISATQGG
ncbi:sulfur carrier protein [Filimonas zeae]|uniref:Thiamine biosynthesis protein ThiS n=1 Tax=Filimonas zeae TaxID=1737353 RepID=A0A917MY28_9BACT|nr:sulfur carrier protein ThiS [Filimonas zeae]MDR6341132.1 sulfur carrier protein [Filimonas zeae]GGH77100.1 thiamine biosynthesis protein ThiS [Filimonas zeae]